MFADKPQSLNDKFNDAAFNLADQTLDLLFPKGLKEDLKSAMFYNLFYKSVAVDAALIGIERLKDSITWDECNLTINTKWGEVGYRNPGCQHNPPPPLINTPLGLPPIENLYCSEGTLLVYISGIARSIVPLSYHLNVDEFEVTWQHNDHRGEVGTVTLLYTNGDNTSKLKAGSGTGEYQGVSSKNQFTTLSNSIGINLFANTDDINRIYSAGAALGRYGYLACCIPPKKPPLPPPPPPPSPKMPECCPGQSNNDALLKLILKRIGTLPVQVPASYLTKNGVQPAQTKQIESLVGFSAWFAERFDETVGEFEITIEINDSDLTKQGEQKQTIRLPNLGEAIAEIFSLLIHSKINNDLILNIVNRNLIESGQIKQSEFKTFSALNALIEYVGFPTNSTSEKMPLLFKPGELSFDKLLKEGEIDVSVLTYTEKNTLAAAMHTLLQAAAIIRAVHFRKTPGNDQQIASTIKNDLTQFLGDNGNLSEQIKTFLGNVENVYNGINS